MGIGSNIEPKLEHCFEALNALDRLESCMVVRVANFYRTEPVGMRDQDWFVNTVAEVATEQTPEQLWRNCWDIETDMKRLRSVRWGPRTIDLDVLLFDRLIMAAKQLTIPHPRLHERRFVLQPLADLIPDAELPGFGSSVAAVLADLRDAGCVELLPGVRWQRRMTR